MYVHELQSQSLQNTIFNVYKYGFSPGGEGGGGGRASNTDYSN